MHLIKMLIVGRISAKGPELRYNARSTPLCSLVVEVDKPGADGQLFTSYHKVEIAGKHAEDLSITLEPGDEIFVEGEHQYRSSVDAKTGQKKTPCVLSTSGISQRRPASSHSPQDQHTDEREGDSSSEGEIVAPGGEERTPAPKARRPRVPKHLQREWQPADRN